MIGWRSPSRTDRTAALQSCSWGIGQIMGENFALAGFADVEQMVAAMSASEDQQLVAMANFLVSSSPERSAAGTRLVLLRPWLQWPQLRHQSL